jgi:protein TonB
VQRHGAVSLHLLVHEPHRHALPAGIALSGLLHAAALGLRPPAQIEPLEPLPLRATSFVVDVIAQQTPALPAAPPAPTAEPPALRARRASAPGVATPRPAVALARPSEPTREEPTQSSSQRAAPARAEPSALPVLAAPANDAATSTAPASSTVNGSGAPGPTAGTVTAGPTPPAQASSDGPRPAARGASRARYLSALSARIRQHRQYPYLARRQGIEGTVCLLVSLDVRGRLLALRVTCGGESEALVEAAKSAVTEAAPFEPLPPDLGTSLAVEVPIVFRLEEG